MSSPKRRDFSNRAATALGLPGADAVEERTVDGVLADHYGIVCQAINALRHGKSLTRFIESNLPGALQSVRQAWDLTDLPDLNPATAALWQKTLRGLPLLSEAADLQRQQQQAVQACAPAVLRFLAEVARADDLSAWANAESAQTLELSDLFDGRLPKHPSGRGGLRRLVFCLYRRRHDDTGEYASDSTVTPGRKPADWDPMFAIDLECDETGTIRPPARPEITIATSMFSSERGGLRGDVAEEDLQAWVNDEWDRGTPVDFPALMHALQERTESRLQATLAELPSRLAIKAAPRLQARLADVATGGRNPHAYLLDQALLQREGNSLLHAVCDRVTRPASPTEILSLHNPGLAPLLGHMDTEHKGQRQTAFPLDGSQRLAARVAIGLLDTAQANVSGSVLPVNGPPGSGKTSFLRAVLASLWVRSALDQAQHPPVVYGTGATNKAVANIIEAFGSVRGQAPGTPECSWIDGLTSYGWFYPSAQAAKDHPDLMQLGWRDKVPFVPGAAAEALADMGHDALQQRLHTLLDRAAEVLSGNSASSSRGNLTLEQVIERVHRKLVALNGEMEQKQEAARQAIAEVRACWAPRRDLRRRIAALDAQREAHAQVIAASAALAPVLQAAANATDVVLREDRFLSGGWRGVFPRLARFFYPRRAQDLQRLREAADQALSPLDLALPLELVSIEQLLQRLIAEKAAAEARASSATVQIRHLEQERWQLQGQLQAHLDSVARALALCRLDSTPAGDRLSWSVLRTLCRAARPTRSTAVEHRASAHEALLHLMDAPLDATLRVPMFHWAARYWEARWLQAWLPQGKKGEQGKAPSKAQRIERLMMLGVVIVATTHKLPSLGEARPADLLVLDEAGQCAPHVAAALLAVTRQAVFVGDVQQLKPIHSMSEATLLALARRAGLETLPAPARPDTGSGMDLARAASTSGSVARRGDGLTPGVLLRYHYRCLPTIIGYCNALMYDGTIVNARNLQRRPSTVPWLPPMSWVDVSDPPQREHRSWVNLAQAQAIVEWIACHEQRLTAQGQRQLADVVAVIAPLGAQITAIRRLMLERLGAQAIQNLVIGTVHALQGAEKPVVLFSLVQTASTNTTGLMADRDGGNLMNVAVSRAQDALVVFADRATLRPAPGDAAGPGSRADGRKPVARLGRYLRQHGRRLYPNTLVVVEAPGKVAAIGQVLGPDVRVVATGGSLKTSSMNPDGTLSWANLQGSEHRAQKAWRQLLPAERGLVDSVVIATDDDLAGELIGLHAAQDVAAAFGQAPVEIRRMRLSALTPQAITDAYRAAGPRFDANMLAAALLREFHHHVDHKRYATLPQAQPYFSPQQRDALSWLHDEEERRGVGRLVEVHGQIDLGYGQMVQVFVATDSGGVAPPLRMEPTTGQALVDALIEMGEVTLSPPVFRRIHQQPPPYPANTTARVLALCADELGMRVADAQEELNALYLEGARVQ